MKGIIFTLLEDVVTAEYGPVAWDHLLNDAGLDGAYTSLGNYSEAEIVALVNVAATSLQIPPADVLRWFGEGALPLLVIRYPNFFNKHTKTRSFLLTLNSIIHYEVCKLHPGATTPVFDFDTDALGKFVVGYNSARKMCMLAEGFMHGAAKHYHEKIDITQSQCMHDGADKCVFDVRFST